MEGEPRPPLPHQRARVQARLARLELPWEAAEPRGGEDGAVRVGVWVLVVLVVGGEEVRGQVPHGEAALVGRGEQVSVLRAVRGAEDGRLLLCCGGVLVLVGVKCGGGSVDID